MAKRQSRRILTLGAVALVTAGLVAAFWPQPVLVDTGEVRRGDMVLTVDEEARTRVRDAYVVSAPVTGRLIRVDLEPGDIVIQGETAVVRMLPTNPSALDARSREQVRASISAAQAALRAAQAELNRAVADRDLAEADAERAHKLFDQGNTSEAVMDRAVSHFRMVEAAVDTARAAISMRIADLDSARAQLISFDTKGAHATQVDATNMVEIPAPITGRVLQVMQQSETTLQAGSPILEIGDTAGDLEVVVELLSTDAVRVTEGDRVIIANWGQDAPLEGIVERIDPWGFTKYSALGVEEQRVNAVIRFSGPADKRTGLGHGFRVETRIVVWEAEDALILPSSALFRDNGNWAVFVDKGGIAEMRRVDIGRNNGIDAQALGGVGVGETVVLFPTSGIVDGVKITPRNDG